MYRQYDEVLSYFIEHPDPVAIPLLLNACGEGSGHGLYQTVEDAIVLHPLSIVLPHLLKALQNASPSIQYWNAHIAFYFSDDSLITPLGDLLHSSNPDLRFAAAGSLEKIDNPRALELIDEALQKETEPDLIHLYHAILS